MSVKCVLFEKIANDEMRNVETMEVMSFDRLPVGAMYYAPWMNHTELYRGSIEWRARPEEDRMKGPLIVKTPGGFWNIDAQATSSQSESGWSRSGDPPNVSATPSINIPGSYHGWLRNGQLEPC